MVNQISNNFSNLPLNSKQGISPEQNKLKQACTEFEAMMVRQMLDSMKGSTKMFGEGVGGDFYQSMFFDAMAKQIAEQGLGLGKMMYQQLEKTNKTK